MMGLLDSNDLTDDPRTQGLLSLGLRLLSSQGKFGPALGQAGLGAMGDLQAAAQQRDARKRAGLQDQMLMMQMEQAKRQQAAQETAQRQQAMDAGLMTRLAGMPVEGQMPQGMQGPGAPRANAGIDPMMFLRQGGSMGGLPQVESINKSLSGPAPIKVGKDEVLLEPGTHRQLFSNVQPDKVKLDDLIIMGPDGKPMINPLALEAKKAIAAAGKTTVSQSVNSGQKGYENESKLRNDFKGEPIYKDYNDMLQAHKQIKAGIAQGTPIGDVATATKVMKLLDPGSVVRESELGIAMAAGGKMDRLQNYVQMQLSGEKLTPTMRKDFGKLADELVAAAGQAYNKKRAEYEGMGKRYGLDPAVLGAPHKQPTDGWEIVR